MIVHTAYFLIRDLPTNDRFREDIAVSRNQPEIRFTENVNDYLIYGVDRDILSVCYDYLTKGVEVFRKEVKLQNSVFNDFSGFIALSK